MRRDFIRSAIVAGIGLALSPIAQANAEATETPTTDQLFCTPKLDRIRTAFIGVDARGSGHLDQMMTLDGVDVIAIADNHTATLNATVACVEKKGRPKPTAFGNGDTDYTRMLERNDIDIIIATPWEWHARMCVNTIKAGSYHVRQVLEVG